MSRLWPERKDYGQVVPDPPPLTSRSVGKEYDGAPGDRYAERLHVTLNRRGMLLLNRNVYEALGRPPMAKLLFDRKNQTIGIRATDPQDKRPFTFKSYRNGSHRELQIHAFCVYYDAVPTETIRFTNPEIDHNQILTLDLQKTEPAASKRKKAGQKPA